MQVGLTEVRSRQVQAGEAQSGEVQSVERPLHRGIGIGATADEAEILEALGTLTLAVRDLVVSVGAHVVDDLLADHRGDTDEDRDDPGHDHISDPPPGS